MEARKFIIISIVLVFLVIAVLFAVLIIEKKKQATQANTPDPVSVQCAFLCETNQKDGFCSQKIRVSDQIRTTCDELSNNSQYSNYNVQPCSTISCVVSAQEAANIINQTTCVALNATWINPTTEGTCPTQEGKFVRKRTPSGQPQITNQICCFYYE